VSLIYKNFLNTLEAMNITPIDALGLEPDTYLHEPVGMQPTEDKNLKGKIIQEFER
jgi:molecular chaperone GrpE (heat shock protein)